MLPAAIGRSDVSWNGLCICVARLLSRAARVRRLAFQVRMTLLEADRLTLRRRTEAGLAKRLQSIAVELPLCSSVIAPRKTLWPRLSSKLRLHVFPHRANATCSALAPRACIAWLIPNGAI